MLVDLIIAGYSVSKIGSENEKIRGNGSGNGYGYGGLRRGDPPKYKVRKHEHARWFNIR